MSSFFTVFCLAFLLVSASSEAQYAPAGAAWGGSTILADAGPQGLFPVVLLDGGAVLTSAPLPVGLKTNIFVFCNVTNGDPVLSGTLQIQASNDQINWLVRPGTVIAMDGGANSSYDWALPMPAPFVRVVENNVADGGVLGCTYLAKGNHH